MERRRDGMLFDRLPAPLRPFTSQVFTSRGQKLMNAMRVPQTLGEENRKLVAGSPLLLGVMLDRSEYRPGELSSFYSVFSMGAALENLWLATVELGMGILSTGPVSSAGCRRSTSSAAPARARRRAGTKGASDKESSPAPRESRLPGTARALTAASPDRVKHFTCGTSAAPVLHNRLGEAHPIFGGTTR